MTAEEMYKTNKDYKEYVDRFVHKNPEYTVEKALKMAVIKDEMVKHYMQK